MWPWPAAAGAGAGEVDDGSVVERWPFAPAPAENPGQARLGNFLVRASARNLPAPVAPSCEQAAAGRSRRRVPPARFAASGCRRGLRRSRPRQCDGRPPGAGRPRGRPVPAWWRRPSPGSDPRRGSGRAGPANQERGIHSSRTTAVCPRWPTWTRWTETWAFSTLSAVPVRWTPTLPVPSPRRRSRRCQDRPVVTQVLDSVVAHVVAGLVHSPLRPPERALHADRCLPAHPFDDGSAVLARHRGPLVQERHMIGIFENRRM